jgi:hypothetical protein
MAQLAPARRPLASARSIQAAVAMRIFGVSRMTTTRCTVDGSARQARR